MKEPRNTVMICNQPQIVANGVQNLWDFCTCGLVSTSG